MNTKPNPTLTETIEWHDASVELPQDFDEKLLRIEDSTSRGVNFWIGYYGKGQWRFASDADPVLGTVTHWADLPKGPNL